RACPGRAARRTPRCRRGGRRPSLPEFAYLDAVEEELDDLLRRAAFPGHFVRVPLAEAHAVAETPAPGPQPSVFHLELLDEGGLQPVRADGQAEVVAAHRFAPGGAVHFKHRHPLRRAPLFDAYVGDGPHLHVYLGHLPAHLAQIHLELPVRHVLRRELVLARPHALDVGRILLVAQPLTRRGRAAAARRRGDTYISVAFAPPTHLSGPIAFDAPPSCRNWHRCSK